MIRSRSVVFELFNEDINVMIWKGVRQLYQVVYFGRFTKSS
jgi:hypothetical protein